MDSVRADTPHRADLVLEGGGVKGLGLVGAVTRFAEAGYRFDRVAGTSAGAITGALVAAMEAADEPLSELVAVERGMDYAKFPDRGPLARRLGPLRPLADGISLLLESGICEGDYLRNWLAEVLAAYGVRTFADLRLPPDDDSDLPGSHRYRLVVTASDLSRQRFIRLPWDYADYGLDPDDQLVADAVRMSAAIPFYFEPVALRGADGGTSTVVDGAVLSNYPITIFDRIDGKPPRWPTFGVRLSLRPEDRPRPEPVEGPLSLALALVDVMIGALDAMHVGDPCALMRSTFVDTLGISATDFDLSDRKKERLFQEGRRAAEEFLAGWDFTDYVRTCRGFAQ